MSKSTLSGLARFFSLNYLQKMSNSSCLLPFYHVVGDAQKLPHVRSLYAIRNEKLFEQDLDTLLSTFQPIALDQLLQLQKGETTNGDKPFFHLSFDDGLKECFEIIAPILYRKGIPATFFVNAAFVDNKALMFRYKASLLINFIEKNPSLRELGSIQKYGEKAKDILLVNYQNAYLLDKLALEIGLDFDGFLQLQKPYMSLEHLKQLQLQGFSIGSHSMDHPMYNSITLEEQLRQTKESQAFLSEKLDLPYKVFAFPFTDDGVNLSFFDEILKNGEFDLTFGGAGIKQDMVSANLQRFPMESQTLESAKAMLSTEYLYAFLRNRLGRGLVIRK